MKKRTLGEDLPPAARNTILSQWPESPGVSDALELAQEKRKLSDDLTGGCKGIPGKANKGAWTLRARLACCSRGPTLEPAARMGMGRAGPGARVLVF